MQQPLQTSGEKENWMSQSDYKLVFQINWVSHINWRHLCMQYVTFHGYVQPYNSYMYTKEHFEAHVLDTIK
jgi:hypothetical protein